MDVNGLLIALLVVSALLNAGAVMFFIKWNKERIISSNSDKLLISIEEFVNKIEEKNEELFQNMTDYIKVKESDFEQRIALLEEKQNFKIEEIVLPEAAEPAKAPESVETLYKQGFSAKQIAKVLGMENGEVELAINMLNKKKSYQK
ncbi:DUF6115 domain-containing protein [Planococcus sp. FY231025]|uniref:DUF6115 domain-containing protein n=1 Tax=Planococcus sp. FY231025 TaxID=3455699 RepID=UPI003F91CACC